MYLDLCIDNIRRLPFSDVEPKTVQTIEFIAMGIVGRCVIDGSSQSPGAVCYIPHCIRRNSSFQYFST